MLRGNKKTEKFKNQRKEAVECIVALVNKETPRTMIVKKCGASETFVRNVIKML